MLIKINENFLAKQISQAEGGAVELSIAQCKEVLRIVLDLLAEEKPSAVLALIEKHQVEPSPEPPPYVEAAHELPDAA